MSGAATLQRTRRPAASETLPLALLLDGLTTAVAVHDSSKLLYANASLRSMFEQRELHDAMDLPAAVRGALRGVTTDNAPTVIILQANGIAVRELRITTRPVRWYGRDVLCSEFVDVGNRRADSAIRLIQDVAAAIRDTTTLTSALREIAHILRGHLAWASAEIWQLDRDGAIRRCCGCSAKTPDKGHCISCDSAAPLDIDIARLFKLQKIVWFGGSPDVPVPLTDASTAAGDSPQAACGVPIVVDGSLVAVMMFYSREPREHDALTTETIAAALSALCTHLERLRIKSELEEADQRLKLILATAGTATWSWGLENNLVRWDTGFVRLYGFSDGVHEGGPAELLARVHPQDRAMVAEAIAASRLACSGLHVEYRIVLHDGSVRWVLARGLTLCDDDGRPERIIGACWDTTEARSAADRIELLAKFHEEYPQPVFRVLPDGTVSEPNSAARALLDRWGTYGSTRVPDELGILRDEARRLNRVCIRDLEIGSAIYLFNIVPVADREYVNVYVSDVTMQRRTEHALQQASKMEAIGQLAGGIAHDFNNRLAIILGNLDMLAEELEDRPDALSMLEEAKQAAERSTNLARQLQTIATPQPAHRNATNPDEVVRRLASLLERCLGPAKRLRTSLGVRNSRVMIDDVAFEDVLINLAINARDAMDDGGTLAIETAEVILDEFAAAGRPSLRPGPYIVLSVSDTGRGMPEEVRVRAFEPFFTTKQQKGTGLGLSMVYSFARQSAGHVELDSRPGEGTLVRIYLPVEPRGDRQ